MAKKPKNRYVRNANISERMFEMVMLLWWSGARAREARAYIEKAQVDWLANQVEPLVAHRVPSREAITILFGEIGDHLWCLTIAGEMVIATMNEGYALPDAVREVCVGVEAYHDLLTEKTTSLPEPIAYARKVLRRPWSVFSESTVGYLHKAFLHQNGFPKSSIYGQLTRSTLYAKHIKAADHDHDLACMRAAREALAVFTEYPMRAPLPEDLYPWVPHWRLMRSE